MLKIIGIPRQFHSLKPKMFFHADFFLPMGETKISDFNYRYHYRFYSQEFLWLDYLISLEILDGA